MSVWGRLKAAVKQGSHPELSGMPAKPRRVHLGIDFGTCWSKIVLRDYEANTDRAFVVRVKHPRQPEPLFRIPSAVTVRGRDLHFGWAGLDEAKSIDATSYRSVKMRAAFPNAPEYARLPALPAGMSAEDVAALVVANLVQIGAEVAGRYVRSLPGGPFQPRIGLTVGVPMGLGQHTAIRERFVTIARTALDLFHNGAPPFATGINLERAKGLLDESRKRIEQKGNVHDPREWVRSEAEAGLLWIFNSPRVPPGLYACVDVGAGTTDVGVFQIGEALEEGVWAKSKLAFYSAASERPGVDGLDEAICECLGDPSLDARSEEAELIRRHGLTGAQPISRVVDQMFHAYRRCWGDAYGKYKKESAWQDFGLFVLGGGSKVPEVVQALSRTPWRGRLADRKPRRNEYPADLFELPMENRGELRPFNGDGAFMLVAYGLSFMGADVPPVDTPDQMPEWTPSKNVRRSIDQDEYYPK